MGTDSRPERCVRQRSGNGRQIERMPGALLILAFAALAIGGLAGCGASSTTVSATAPTISFISPTSGFAGNSIAITGTNYGATQDSSTVTFNGVSAAVTAWSTTSITATVPLTATTGNVVVTVSGVASNGNLFTVDSAPNITSLSQTLGAVGQPITINGVNFGSAQGSSTVTFGTTSPVTATVTSWSGTAIVVTVPTGATTGSLQVTVGGLGASTFFTVVPAPTITSLSQPSGLTGISLTITGTNFGAAQGNSTVSFQGTFAAAASAWSATSITVTVPAAATTGGVIVSISGVVPSNGVNFTVTGIGPSVKKASIFGAVCGSGSESLLSGAYAYSVQGFVGGGVGSPMARIGSFTADGSGGIALGDGSGNGGEEDLNVSSGPAHHAVLAQGSSYSVGSDRRGCVTLALAGGASATFRFSLGGINASSVATRGSIIQFDDVSGAGTRGAGILVRQDQTAFAAGALQKNYAFGMSGQNSAGGHVGMAGSFAFDSNTGNISSGYLDYNDAGNMPFGAHGTAGVSTGNLAVGSIASGTGRTTGSFSTGTVNGAAFTFHWAVYVVNANQFMVISTDTLGTTTPLVAGQALATGAQGSFSANSLSGPYVVGLQGTSGGRSAVSLQLLTAAPGNAFFSGASWTYGLANNPSAQNALPVSGHYAVDSASGRVTLSDSDASLIFYLSHADAAPGTAAFVVDAAADGASGFASVQSAAAITDGSYFFGTAPVVDNTVTEQVGTFSFVGGVASGALDQSNVVGLATSTPANVAFTANSDGSVTALDAAGATIVGIPTGNGLIWIDESGSAALGIVEQ